MMLTIVISFLYAVNANSCNPHSGKWCAWDWNCRIFGTTKVSCKGYRCVCNKNYRYVRGSCKQCPKLPTTTELYQINCPIIASLAADGVLDIHEHRGAISATDIYDAFTSYLGADSHFAFYQAAGIARFPLNDPLQKGENMVGLFHLAKTALSTWLNIHTGDTQYTNVMKMQPKHQCQNEKSTDCSWSTPLVQHGLSTTMRDNRFDIVDPGQKKRFQHWFGQPIGSKAKFDFKQFTRMMKMIADPQMKETRSWNMPDWSGEYSPPWIDKLHPSIDKDLQPAARTWQYLPAWSGWWIGLARDPKTLQSDDPKWSQTLYFFYEDLKYMFLKGRMYPGWKRREGWGVQGILDTFILMEKDLELDASIGQFLNDAISVRKQYDGNWRLAYELFVKKLNEKYAIQKDTFTPWTLKKLTRKMPTGIFEEYLDFL